uniref:C6.1a n=1 Tax=Rhizophora mucronata TaxID=61149 RepID=A0A2P2KPG3_RHIMU
MQSKNYNSGCPKQHAPTNENGHRMPCCTEAHNRKALLQTLWNPGGNIHDYNALPHHKLPSSCQGSSFGEYHTNQRCKSNPFGVDRGHMKGASNKTLKWHCSEFY